MTDLFKDVDLAAFGLEDDGSTIDQNSSIEAGGGTNPQYFTAEAMRKAVVEQGLIDDVGDLTQLGREYLLNDQGFLDNFPTPEMQDTFFNNFNKVDVSVEELTIGPGYFDSLMRAQGWRPKSEIEAEQKAASVENIDPGSEFNLDFGNLIVGGTDNSGKATDNAPATSSTDNGEATPLHGDANAPQQKNDPDTGEVATPAPSLEQYLHMQIGLEDVSINTADGTVPSNINPQMAVLPVNDPTKPKTLEELYKDMDLEPAPSVTDDSVGSNLSVDEAVMLNSKTTGILASTGFDLTTATEDLSMGDTPAVLAEINALQEINNRIRERETDVVDIQNTIIENGGVDRQTVERIEKLKEGIITTKFSLESFGSYPTRFGYTESLEATDAIKFGALAAGGVVLFGTLVKLVMWIRDKFNQSKVVTEKNRDAVRKVTQSLSGELIRIERDYSDDLSKNEKFKLNYIEMAKRYSLRASFGSTSLLEVNDGIRTSVVHKNLRGHYNDIMKLMIESDKIQQMTRSLIDAIQATAPAIEGSLHDLTNKFSGQGDIDPDQYKIDFKFVEGLEKSIGISSSGTEPERLTYFNDKLKSMLQPNSGASIPTFNKLIEFKFDLDGAYQYDQKYQKTLKNMLNDLVKLRKQAEVLTDKATSDNRIECIEVIKRQITVILTLSSNLIGIRESARKLLTGGNGATKEAIAAWSKLFEGTGITFKVGA